MIQKSKNKEDSVVKKFWKIFLKRKLSCFFSSRLLTVFNMLYSLWRYIREIGCTVSQTYLTIKLFSEHPWYQYPGDAITA